MVAMGTAVGPADFVPADICGALGIGLTLHLNLSFRSDAPALWAGESVRGGTLRVKRGVGTR